VRKEAIVALLALALLLLAACSNSSPTTTTAATTAAEVPTAAPADDTPTASLAAPSTAPASATRSGSGPLPTATATAPRPSSAGTAPRATSAAAAGTPLPTLGAGQVYKDPQGRFSFTIPSNWTLAQPAGAEVAFQSPVPSGTIPATVNIVLEKLPSASVTLDEYDQAGEANLKQQFPDYKSLGVTKVTIDGKPAYKRVYTATIAGRVLQLQQVYLIERDTAYVISCGSPQENFAANAAVFDQISGTFKIGQ
jgi:hypothetical protein